MQATRPILVERIEKFLSDTYFVDVNLRGKIYPQKSSTEESIQLQVSPKTDRITYQDALQLKYEPCKIGQSFGPSWVTYWFKLNIHIPQSFKGKEVHLLWNSSSEALIWKDGVPIQGLTGGTWVDKRIEYQLTKVSNGDEQYEFMIEMACNGMFGTGKDGLINAPDPDKTFTLNQCEVAVFDRECYSLFTYISMLYDMAKNLKQINGDNSNGSGNNTLTEYSLRSNQALHVANEIINKCDTEDRSTWPQCLELAKKFFNQRNGDSAHQISAIGHCHIDVAWLWPYDETKRKSARSFATQIHYMDMYKNYKFVQSQAQLYKWVKELYPQLYEKIKEKVKQGQFVVTGGTWVEMDGNLPSGESFIRQFFHGQTFFKQEFGVHCKEFWLPDTFGYSGQLPQIIRHMGIENFITQKLSWNNINKFPHNTFFWEGIDGSKVLTHFPPANTYNSAADVKEIVFSATNHKNIDVSNNSLLVYGHGDGGGGPNIEMLERLSILTNTDGIPKVEMESPTQFFERIQGDKDNLQTWIGELYFELHRGTYTSQAACKKGNRVGETLLHNIEALSSYLEFIKLDKFKYPQLDSIWELLLLNQFHDVLPGSSIGMVYVDAAKHHGEISTKVNELIQDSLRQSVTPSNDEMIVFNPTPFELDKIIEVPSTVALNNAQPIGDGNQLINVKVPSYTFVKVNQQSQTKSTERVVGATLCQKDGSIKVENDFIELTLSKDGTISSLIEKATGRQVIQTNQKANQFVLYDDIPLFWQAWDVEIYSQFKFKPCHAAVGGGQIIENGPHRVAIAFDYPSLTTKSKATQIVYCYSTHGRVDFNTTIDWKESHKLLRVEFPTTIRTMNAKFDIQLGHVERPTHKNTSWDIAKFEVCGHKWADQSEYGFGVALLNDCKYGYSMDGGIMKLSLLRSPKAPDDQCDMGINRFTYSILPHQGDLQSGGVIKHGYDVNNKFYHVVGKSGINDSLMNQPLIFVDGGNGVVVETIKKAQDGRGWIVRVYESYGGHTSYTFKGLMVAGERKLYECNGLEEVVGEELKLSGKITLSPFQLKSFRLI